MKLSNGEAHSFCCNKWGNWKTKAGSKKLPALNHAIARKDKHVSIHASLQSLEADARIATAVRLTAEEKPHTIAFGCEIIHANPSEPKAYVKSRTPIAKCLLKKLQSG